MKKIIDNRVGEIIRNLSDRKGFDFGGLDDEILQEIKEEIAASISGVFNDIFNETHVD